MDDLIFDRTLSDVETALNNPSNELFLKGAYNYTDLNRVESWCKHIQDRINEVGILETPVSIITKTDWIVTDFIRVNDIDRIIDNVDTLLDALSVIGETITFTEYWNYLQANALENNLYLLKERLKIYKNEIRRCGTFICGSQGLGICGEVVE